VDNGIDIINSVSRYQIQEMQNLAQKGALDSPDSSKRFNTSVSAVQAAIVNTFQVTAHIAVRLANPADAAEVWHEYIEICDLALNTLKDIREKNLHAGGAGLYDLALEYRHEALCRRQQNLQDAECLKVEIPPNLFPSLS
jgi:hypothetical protein